MSEVAVRGQQSRILLIEDDAELVLVLERMLAGFGYAVDVASDGEQGLARYAAGAVDLVLLDVGLPRIGGQEVLEHIRASDEDAAVIVMTGDGSVETAVRTMKAGALDYLPKPLDFSYLELVLAKALASRRQREEIRLLKSQVSDNASFEGLVGVSPGMQRVYKLIRQVAASEATVLIEGETGTGKEMVARAVHRLSGHRAGGWMPVNCGALAESILESELFGHERGAFTGATRQKVGLLEQAAQGTLFLDEIETMSPALQVKLLRAIQEREILRVGGQQPVKVDFRLVAASNAGLEDLVNAGDFRQDLFYRLSVVVIELPPLRERKEDIPLLAGHLAHSCASRNERSTPVIAPEAMMLLRAHDWPGNVRELENTLERAILLGEGNRIGPEDLPPAMRAALDIGQGGDLYQMSLREARSHFERQYLEAVIQRTEGNISEAARQAGVNRQYLYEKMKQCGISRP